MKLRSQPSADSGWLTGLGVLILGIAIGSLAKPSEWIVEEDVIEATSEDVALEDVPLQRPMTRGETTPAPVDNGLETLYVDLDEEASRVLQRVHDRSHESGMIVQAEGDLVPARVRLKDRTVEARVRIKGDYLDHLRGDKWSMRVELRDDKLMGMSRFSFQHPNTRGYLWEWLIMQVARREGLLAPRSTFVNVVVNDNEVGVFYLEEHFTKELLESQGRREGPIVRFDEGTAMGNAEQYAAQMTSTPPSVRRATFLTTAEINAFGEKRLAQAENLARQLEEALDQMQAIQADVMLETPYINASVEARLQAARSAAGTVEEVIDVDMCARMHALMALFRCKHGMAWKNRRFYHNPVTGRLEPVVYDTLAGLPISERDPLAMYTHTSRAFARSSAYHNALFEHVARMAHPEYLRELFAELEEDLHHFSAVMREEGIEDRQSDVTEVVNQLYDQQVYLRELLRPRNAVAFDARLLSRGSRESNLGDLVIEAWATTEIPIAVSGFHLTNGSFLSARNVLASDGEQVGELFGDAILFDGRDGVSRLRGEPGTVILPHDGRRATFRFPNDVRLSTLRDVQDQKQAALANTETDKSFKLEVEVEYRYLTESTPRRELLWIRRFDESWSKEGGRPAAATAKQTIARHAFLDYEEGSSELVVRAGDWQVEGDLVVPDGFQLRAGPGVRMSFAEGCGIVSGEALLFEGSAEEPIRLGPIEGAPHWAGVAVLNAPDRCVWKHVRVDDTNVFSRGGWIMTGGVVFYKTPVSLTDVAFVNAHGEDALNIFGTNFDLTRILVDTCASDAFDGDFVTGTVRESTFKNSVEDGVDVSGSDVDVVECRFIDVGDKGVSAGEDSIVRVRDCVVESASIGVASKDFSRVDVDGLVVEMAENYGFAVYIKKPEFGASSIDARRVELGQMGLGASIVQDTCSLTVDGVAAETQPIDVKEMYRRKILGK